MAAGDRAPRRALIVSAAIGEGHNAAGRALEQAISRAWPGCQVSWLDALSVMAPGMGPLARAVYVLEVQRLSWMYEFFFSAIWRHRWFLDSTRTFIGAWCGRRMAPRVRAAAPDVIISTYPLGSAGLSWLRQHRTLKVPVGAWVSDFCPHPYWMYRDLDITYVMHPAAIAVAEQSEPSARVAVGALPVTDAFTPADRAAARARLGLDPDRFTALLCTGSLAFGDADHAVTALVAAGPQVQVVVVCGRNGRLLRRLSARGEPATRLLVVGWTDVMQDWMTAADVVVTNAGGVTALEAIACARPVVMFEPIAGHGRANAALMASCGSALLPASAAELTATVSRLAVDLAARAELSNAALAAAGSRRREDDLAGLAAMPGRGRPSPRPLRAEDAFFLHVQAGGIPQQVGAVVTMAGRVELSRLQAAVAVRAERIPQLRRRLVPASGRWARERRVDEEKVDVACRIAEVTRGVGGAPASLDEVVGRFFAVPLDPRQDAWGMLLVHAPPGDPGALSAIVVKVHHALGDSYAIISALSGLFDQAAGRQPRGAAKPRPPAARARAVLGLPGRAARAARGLASMALAGPAPQTCISGGGSSPGRRFASVRLESRTVTIAARRLGGTTADLVLALMAEALGRVYAAWGEPVDGRTVRAMVPHTLRAAGAAPRPAAEEHPAAAEATGGDPPGNRAAGLLLDLPIGPMPLAERVAAVHTLWRARLRRGDAHAAATVLRAANLLPPPVQRAFARRCYTGRRFNLIVSVFPGIRQPCQLLGTQIAEVYPVLALANGVGLAVGAMTWGKSLSLGLLADEALVPDLDGLVADIKRSFADLGRPSAAVPRRQRLTGKGPRLRRLTSAGQRE